MTLIKNGFAGDSQGRYITDRVSSVQGRITRAAAGSVTGLAPGDYLVGFWLTNHSNSESVDNNVNGWVMLTTWPPVAR